MAHLPAVNRISSKKKWRIRIFVAVMIAYPVAHFSLFWIFVNFNSIVLSMQRMNIFGDTFFAGFENYGNVIRDIRQDQAMRNILINSMLFFPVTCLITIPLSLLFSYFLFKKMPAANGFRVIFFLPSIMPIVALTFAFSTSFNSQFGFVNPALRAVGLPGVNWFGERPWTQIIVFMYCVWAGLGFNIVLLSGAMGRVPQEVVESAKLDGITMRKEFRLIMIPLIWPTVVTLFILAMTSVLTVFLQPMLLTGGGPHGASGTISLAIFEDVRSNTGLPGAAAFGLLMSLIFAPLIMITRFFLSKLWAGVDY